MLQSEASPRVVRDPDVPHIHAVITDPILRAFPCDPERTPLVITLINSIAPDEIIDGHVFEGREGLLKWYTTTVGYNPDEDNRGPIPILELVDLVASMLILYEWDRCSADD